MCPRPAICCALTYTHNTHTDAQVQEDQFWPPWLHTWLLTVLECPQLGPRAISRASTLRHMDTSPLPSHQALHKLLSLRLAVLKRRCQSPLFPSPGWWPGVRKFLLPASINPLQNQAGQLLRIENVPIWWRSSGPRRAWATLQSRVTPKGFESGVRGF